MTLERTDFSIRYEVTPGVFQFPFEFPAKDVNDIKVFDLDPALPKYDPNYETPVSGFSVSAAVNGIRHGGTVILSTLPDKGHLVEIRRVTPAFQLMALQSQQRIPPEHIESTFDSIVMMIQELSRQGALEELGIEVSELINTVSLLKANMVDKTVLDSVRAALEAKDASLAEAIAAEALARSAGDKTLGQQIEANRTDIDCLDADKMPIAPDDGNIYVGSGRTWAPLVLDIGDPFAFDADGDVVIVERPAYFANRIWDIHPDELILSEASQPGDRDSIFTVDADGDIVIE